MAEITSGKVTVIVMDPYETHEMSLMLDYAMQCLKVGVVPDGWHGQRWPSPHGFRDVLDSFDIEIVAPAVLHGPQTGPESWT